MYCASALQYTKGMMHKAEVSQGNPVTSSQGVDQLHLGSKNTNQWSFLGHGYPDMVCARRLDLVGGKDSTLAAAPPPYMPGISVYRHLGVCITPQG